MPTNKPRITITFTEQQYATIWALSEVQGVSMSSIVVDLLDTTLPVLDRLVQVLQNAADAPQSVLDDIRDSMETAVIGIQSGGARAGVALAAPARVAPGSDGVEWWNSINEDDRAMWLRRAGSAVPADAWEAFKRATKKRGPPTSNRGVRNTSPNVKIAQISPMKKGEKNDRAEK